MELELKRMFELKEAEMSVPATLPSELRTRIGRQRVVMGGLVAAAAVAVVFGGIAGARALTNDEPLPPAMDSSVFVDTWVSTDVVDGSTQTMVVQASAEGVHEIVVRDDSAGVCSGAPSTMTGTGRRNDAGELVIPSPEFTCNDGSEPKVEDGPPVEELLRNLTFVHDPEADTLLDTLGLVWGRGGTPESLGGMWPQSSLEEIQEAQELADADDPRYTWQVDPHLAALTGPGAVEGGPYEAKIFTRFIREKLGWQEFRAAPFVGSASSPGRHEGVTYVRCAPGRANPLYPNDPEGRGCAPTIDKLHYETVAIDAAQLDRQGSSGIWVVTGWTMPPPSEEPITPNSDLYGRQVEQVAPPTDEDVSDLVEAFLQARIDGEGAEEYLHSLYTPPEEIPLLYATTSGGPYERFEIEWVEGPHWPAGGLTIEVRLFAEAGNIVEQTFSMHREGNGRLGLEYFGEGTTEDGEVVAEPSSILDGQVTYAAGPDWREISAVPEYGYLQGDGVIEVLPNSLAPDDCEVSGGTPPSAEELVRAIRSDPDLETTAAVPARVGGIDALQLDVAAVPGAASCGGVVQVAPSSYGEAPGWGVINPEELGRLYVLNLPEPLRAPSGVAPARTLTILIKVPGSPRDLERAVASAAPILDSFEFHAK